MPSYSDPVIAPAFLGGAFQTNPFGIVFYVGNTTNPTEDQGSPGVTPRRQGRSPKSPFSTIQRAIDEAVGGRGDLIVIQRGTYSEALTVNKAGLTLMGALPYGYPDQVVVSGLTVVTASRVHFYTMEFFSNSATGASVRVGSNTAEVDSAWFENCSFASNGTTEPLYGCIVFGGNNHTWHRCRFIDNGRALSLRSGVDSFISGVRIDGCQFLENTTYDIGTGSGLTANAPDFNGFGRDGGVRNLVCRDNVFGRGEVTPADYVNISGTSSGIMTGNRFALATNASADIVIPAGILYAANATEAGWSTARPA